MKNDYRTYSQSIEPEITAAFNKMDRVEREAFIRSVLRKLRGGP